MSLINTVANIGLNFANKIITLTKKTPTQPVYDYFETANTKMNEIQQAVFQFVSFCQTWLYLPTIIMVIVCGFAFYGGKKGQEWATSTFMRVVGAVAIVMCAVSIASLICNLFLPDNPSSFTM